MVVNRGEMVREEEVTSPFVLIKEAMESFVPIIEVGGGESGPNDRSIECRKYLDHANAYSIEASVREFRLKRRNH